MVKVGYKIGGRSLRDSGLSSACLVRRMAIWIYDKHTLIAKARSCMSGSNALFVVNRSVASGPQHTMAFLSGASYRNSVSLQVNGEDSGKHGSGGHGGASYRRHKTSELQLPGTSGLP